MFPKLHYMYRWRPELTSFSKAWVHWIGIITQYIKTECCFLLDHTDLNVCCKAGPTALYQSQIPHSIVFFSHYESLRVRIWEMNFVKNNDWFYLNKSRKILPASTRIKLRAENLSNVFHMTKRIFKHLGLLWLLLFYFYFHSCCWVIWFSDSEDTIPAFWELL